MIEMLAASPLKAFLSDVYRAAKGPLKQAIQSTITEEAEEKRARYATQIGDVKTIWQVDRSIKISEFYYPTRINFEKEVARVEKVDELLKTTRAVVVEGIAGQGKSIFLRHLCMNCLTEASYIPVFVQLRHISSKTSLIDLILEGLNAVGVTNDRLVIEYFLRKGKVIFLLDGFDEVDSEFRATTIRTIEDYLHNYKRIKIIVTSRPESDIQHSPNFTVTEIRPLNASDRRALIRHLVDDQATKDMLLEALEGKNRIAGVLTTPLLVTLLIITYKAESEIPENLSEFYRSLFVTLLKRHDRTKPGYTRERKSPLGNVEFERVFENLCFLTLNSYKVSMSQSEFYDFAKAALRAQCMENIDAEHYMEDLVRITSLIVLDGGKYYYLHKTIPEYFAAQKIAEEKNVEHKSRFYAQLRMTKIPENWYQTLLFLNEIDEYAFTKELLLPYYYETFGVTEDDVPVNPPSFTRERLVEIVGERATLDLRDMGEGRVSIGLRFDSGNWLAHTRLHLAIQDTVDRFINNLSAFRSSWLYGRYSESKFFIDCFDYASLWPEFLQSVNSDSPLRAAYSDILVLRKKLEQREDKSRPLFELNLRS